MKNKIIFFIEILILACFFSLQTFGQSRPGISIYYNYSIRFQEGENLHFPIGLGTSFNKPLNDRLTFNAGFGYSFRESSIQVFHDLLFDPPNKSTGKVRESSFLLYIGFYYEVLHLNDKLSIKIGANLNPAYSRTKMIITNYYDTYKSTITRKYDFYSIAINPGLRFEYAISNGISVFIEPGYRYYFLGDYSKLNALNCDAGINIYFK